MRVDNDACIVIDDPATNTQTYHYSTAIHENVSRVQAWSWDHLVLGSRKNVASYDIFHNLQTNWLQKLWMQIAPCMKMYGLFDWVLSRNYAASW